MAMTQSGFQGDGRPVYFKVTEAHFERSYARARLTELSAEAVAGISWCRRTVCDVTGGMVRGRK